MTIPRIFDRMLLPVRLARARAQNVFLPEEEFTPLTVDALDLQFPEGEAAYNGMGVDREGSIWFSVGTRDLDRGARIMVFDPRDRSLTCASDLTATLASPARAIPHGKVHTDLTEIDGRMYGASHLGFYDRSGGVERPGRARGYADYPGGWIFSVEKREVGEFATTPLAQAPEGEGIIAMAADRERGLLYGLTWPHAKLLRLDLASRELRDFGAVSGSAESGSLRDGTWSRVCRSLVVDPESVSLFWSRADGRVMRLAADRIEEVASLPDNEMWRKAIVDARRGIFWCVCWSSSTLYRFDPASRAIERIVSLAVTGAKSPPAATLAFALSPDGRTAHYLATGPGILRERAVQLASSVWHLTIDLESREVRRTGPLRTSDGRWLTQAQSLLVSGDSAYSVCTVEVPNEDDSPVARRIRALRRNEPEMRSRGYAWEMKFVRIPL